MGWGGGESSAFKRQDGSFVREVVSDKMGRWVEKDPPIQVARDRVGGRAMMVAAAAVRYAALLVMPVQGLAAGLQPLACDPDPCALLRRDALCRRRRSCIWS